MQGDKTTQKVESQEGARNGLRLTLDLHSNTVSLGTTNQQHSAFKLFIGEPAQFPMVMDKSIPLQPGREHFVDLSATVVTTNGIKDISPEDRGCLFTDESNLEFYKGYTFTNCRLECAIKKAEEEHKCIPWHLPKVSLSSEWKNSISKGAKLVRLRPLDCEGLYGGHEKAFCPMPVLFIRY